MIPTSGPSHISNPTACWRVLSWMNHQQLSVLSCSRRSPINAVQTLRRSTRIPVPVSWRDQCVGANSKFRKISLAFCLSASKPVIATTVVVVAACRPCSVAPATLCPTSRAESLYRFGREEESSPRKRISHLLRTMADSGISSDSGRRVGDALCYCLQNLVGLG